MVDALSATKKSRLETASRVGLNLQCLPTTTTSTSAGSAKMPHSKTMVQQSKKLDVSGRQKVLPPRPTTWHGKLVQFPKDVHEFVTTPLTRIPLVRRLAVGFGVFGVLTLLVIPLFTIFVGMVAGGLIEGLSWLGYLPGVYAWAISSLADHPWVLLGFGGISYTAHRVERYYALARSCSPKERKRPYWLIAGVGGICSLIGVMAFAGSGFEFLQPFGIALWLIGGAVAAIILPAAVRVDTMRRSLDHAPSDLGGPSQIWLRPRRSSPRSRSTPPRHGRTPWNRPDHCDGLSLRPHPP